MADSSRPPPSLTPQPLTGASAANVWNEMLDARGNVRPHWHDLHSRISRLDADQRATLASTASRMIEDLGTTFNVYSDVGGAGQPYELDPIPLIIPPSEWAHVSAGLAQRIHLIDLVINDLYGPQNLLKEGLIPPDLVHSSPHFPANLRGIQPLGEIFLMISGCDLVRSADGSWTVMRDYTGASPGGLGQVLENRNVSSSLLPEAFAAQNTARLGEFFDLERSTLQSLAPSRTQLANVVFLTPGFKHPSYFEHAYKARLLGFPLVEAEDLTVRERRLFLKTLAGLQRIDSVACRIDTEGIDPLEAWVPSGGGIPGLLEAWRAGNVALVNAPGSGFASTAALMPFLPGICRKWLREEIKLPFLETWWLGQPRVRQRVFDQLHRYILLPAFRHHPLLPIRCSTLTQAARKQWITAIEEHPYNFVAQLDTTLSESPSLESRGIRDRPIVWRAFTLNATSGPMVLPGGLARVGKSSQPPQLWPEHAGFTKDIWISNNSPLRNNQADFNIARGYKDRHPASLEVPSRIAEQLYWVGRYAERIEFTARLLRVTLRTLGGEGGQAEKGHLNACITLLRDTTIIPKNLTFQPHHTTHTLAGLIHDPHTLGSIPTLTRSLLRNAAAARDRLSNDTWRFFNRLETIIHTPPHPANTTELLRTLDHLILHLAAFAGMQAENMTRGQGWRFLEIGRRIERALGTIALLKSASQYAEPKLPILESLLETCDSVMTYRRRHFSNPEIKPVMDLIFFDRTNPRSVAFQSHIINLEIPNLTGDHQAGLLPQIHKHLLALEQRFNSPHTPTPPDLESLADSLGTFSDLLTQHYFSHSVRRVY